ncbi:isochorismatase family cysteine hydrolase [Bacillus sp. AFS041924]|uniref:isochorismatase family cysteine hydrolase n=1 Tax=Bacillus sp. AFS041924 TaxID=2033503 RepID=UPI000BFC4281|nr:isochorismatase family cysteine hydrolase [Bacillus sp. AFS041924]PGS49427.1 isochorismatase [Bacillus sp. AFS041924]
MKIAFLIIDMQKIFLEDKKESLNVESACEYINYVASQIRSKNHLVIHVQDIEGADDINSDLLSFIPEIKVEEQDICMTKEDSNAFWNTELEQILKGNDVKLVIIAGFAAEHCVLFTYNGASERGFKPVILQNGILSTKSDVITQTYRDRNIISYNVVPFIV